MRHTADVYIHLTRTFCSCLNSSVSDTKLKEGRHCCPCHCKTWTPAEGLVVNTDINKAWDLDGQWLNNVSVRDIYVKALTIQLDLGHRLCSFRELLKRPCYASGVFPFPLVCYIVLFVHVKDLQSYNIQSPHQGYWRLQTLCCFFLYDTVSFLHRNERKK